MSVMTQTLELEKPGHVTQLLSLSQGTYPCGKLNKRLFILIPCEEIVHIEIIAGLVETVKLYKLFSFDVHVHNHWLALEFQLWQNDPHSKENSCANVSNLLSKWFCVDNTHMMRICMLAVMSHAICNRPFFVRCLTFPKSPAIQCPSLHVLQNVAMSANAGNVSHALMVMSNVIWCDASASFQNDWAYSHDWNVNPCPITSSWLPMLFHYIPGSAIHSWILCLTCYHLDQKVGCHETGNNWLAGQWLHLPLLQRPTLISFIIKLSSDHFMNGTSTSNPIVVAMVLSNLRGQNPRASR